MLAVEDIRRIVEASDWESLIGEVESDYLECKKVAYRLGELADKDELAKDASSFANAAGGFILLGVETKASATHPTDEIVALRPFGKDLLDPNQYHSILRDWVIPDIEGLKVSWAPQAGGAAQGFGVIEIPPQAETHRPFVVTRPVLEEGRRRALFVGFVQRKGATSSPAGPIELAQWLRQGRNYQERVESRLDQIATAVEEIRLAGSRPPAPEGIRPDQVIARVSDALGATGLVNRPYYVLSAWPTPPSELQTVLRTGPGTITSLLERPPSLRYAGWSLETLDQARMVEGLYRQVTNGDRKVLRLYRDGMMVHAASAGPDFLGWGEPDEYRAHPRIISLALIEVTYLFCLMYAEVVKDLRSSPRSIGFNVQLGQLRTDATEQPVNLHASVADPVAMMLERDQHPAPQNTYDSWLDVAADEFDPGATAYKIVQEIFLWFGNEADQVPYTETVSGTKVVSPEKIRARGR